MAVHGNVVKISIFFSFQKNSKSFLLAQLAKFAMMKNDEKIGYDLTD